MNDLFFLFGALALAVGFIRWCELGLAAYFAFVKRIDEEGE